MDVKKASKIPIFMLILDMDYQGSLERLVVRYHGQEVAYAWAFIVSQLSLYRLIKAMRR